MHEYTLSTNFRARKIRSSVIKKALRGRISTAYAYLWQLLLKLL